VWRLFVAAPVSPSVSEALAAATRRLARFARSGQVRWTPPEQQHLTLRFLGDSDPSRVADLAGLLDRLAREVDVLRLHVQGLGAFPDADEPRVLWAGLRADAPRRSLSAWQRHLERGVVDLGWPKEPRAWRPHLTLGRIRGGGLKPGWHEITVDETAWTIEEIRLMRSDLDPQGARHTTLHSASLRHAS
jgi:2'-5' RNA ligase